MADEAETPIETAPEAPATVAVPVEPAALDVVPAVEVAAETPAPKATRGRKPKAPPAEAIAPVETSPVETAPVEAAPAEAAPAEAAPVMVVAPASALPAKAARRAPKAPAKRVPVKSVPLKPVQAKTGSTSPATPRIAVKPPRKIAAAKAPATPAKISTVTTTKNNIVGFPALSQLKDKLMAKTIPTDFTASIQTAFSDMQEKAKSAYEKSTEALGEANDFAKGNVEAIVESSKLLASGLQELGSAVVAESKSAFETISADVKELASVKTPTEFFQLQSAMVRKSFDGAVAQASKNTEAMMKLVTEVMSPISTRVSLAVEKAGKAA